MEEPMQLSAAAFANRTLLHLVFRLGGPGLIALGIVDNSAIPLPGGMDAATILLAAAHREPWWYYAIMALIGSLIGGYLTYRLGYKGGEETLDKKLSKKRAKQADRVFRKYGFWSIAVSAVCPPPIPIVPTLIVAGALKYPRNRFLAALALGRGVRYTLLAYLGHRYGHSILHWLGRYYKPLLYTLIGLVVLGVVGGLILWQRQKHKSKSEGDTDSVRSRQKTRQLGPNKV
jgi:membrane protein YqaA with SNARE-associated domain